MIYLEFEEGQGLGNQLWNYVTLRSISKKIGLGYKIINPEKFKGKNFLDITYSENYKEDTCTTYSNEKCYQFIFKEKLYYDKILKTFASDFDSEILKIKSNTLIKGLFQSEQYLFNNDINKFIKLKKSNKNKLKPSQNICILNIRGGEYKRFKNLILPKSYWLNSIKNMRKIENKMQFFIVTDDYDYAKNLLPQLKILKGNLAEDFTQLFQAKYLIVSNSSFSYFPISLGLKPLKVIAPAYWARFGNTKKRWVSPCNYYKNWCYQNEKGEIMSKLSIEKSINKTRQFYSTFNVLTTEEILSKKTLFSLFPKKFRKIIKKVLKKIFPLHIG